MTAKRPTAIPRAPSVEQQVADLSARLYEIERAGAGSPQTFRDLADARGSVMLHGQSWVYNFDTGFYQPRTAERAAFSYPGPAAGWNTNESGPWPLMLGYVGEFWLLAVGIKDVASTDITVDFLLNHTLFDSVTLPAGQDLEPLKISHASTGADSDVISVQLVGVPADGSDLTAYARYF